MGASPLILMAARPLIYLIYLEEMLHVRLPGFVSGLALSTGD